MAGPNYVASRSSDLNAVAKIAGATESLLVAASDVLRLGDANRLHEIAGNILALTTRLQDQATEIGRAPFNAEERQQLHAVFSPVRFQCVLLAALLRKYKRLLRLRRSVLMLSPDHAGNPNGNDRHWY